MEILLDEMWLMRTGGVGAFFFDHAHHRRLSQAWILLIYANRVGAMFAKFTMEELREIGTETVHAGE